MARPGTTTNCHECGAQVGVYPDYRYDELRLKWHKDGRSKCYGSAQIAENFGYPVISKKEWQRECESF